MINQDFTLVIYRQLLISLQQNGYKFITFENWCKEKKNDKIVILRHDVDLLAINSLEVAKIEFELNIKATYYFRVVPQSNQPEIIKSIVKLGHEIGYHYEDLSIYKGNVELSINHFKKQLQYFRSYYPVKTICMHGSPVSKYDNRNLWKYIDYHDFSIIGEPYFDFLNRKDINYFTDTARMWNGDKYNIRDKSLNKAEYLNNNKIHTTFDLINWIKTSGNENPLMITTHPQRWTENKIELIKEYFKQNIKNLFKMILIKIS